MVVLLGVTLLPLQEVRPSADVLQALLGIPHGDDLQGLVGGQRVTLPAVFGSPWLVG